MRSLGQLFMDMQGDTLALHENVAVHVQKPSKLSL